MYITPLPITVAHKHYFSEQLRRIGWDKFGDDARYGILQL